MNTTTRHSEAHFPGIETLLQQQLDVMNGRLSRTDANGPPGAPLVDFEMAQADGFDFLASGVGNLPFLDLDPYHRDDNGDPPSFTIGSPDPDYINWELGGTPDQLEHDLGVYNATMVSDIARLHVEALSETRISEIQYSHLNGEKIAIEWQNAMAHVASGTIDYMGQGTLLLNSGVEVAESVQAERFFIDENGNLAQGLSAYDWGMGMTLDGMAHSYGIDTFEMEFNIDISMQWDPELGFYLADVTVAFVYTIEFLDGRVIEREAFQEEMGFWSDLDLFKFEFNGDILAEIAGFQRDMGGAWDAIQSYDDHMKALLTHLKDEGWYDMYDQMGGGIDNPFGFDLPTVDPFA